MPGLFEPLAKPASPSVWFYGNIVSHMKTTIDLPDDLLVAAKKKAAEERTTLRALFERGLRSQLRPRPKPTRTTKRRLRWITVRGGLPPGLEIADRAAMHEWLRRNR